MQKGQVRGRCRGGGGDKCRKVKCAGHLSPPPPVHLTFLGGGDKCRKVKCTGGGGDKCRKVKCTGGGGDKCRKVKCAGHLSPPPPVHLPCI